MKLCGPTKLHDFCLCHNMLRLQRARLQVSKSPRESPWLLTAGWENWKKATPYRLFHQILGVAFFQFTQALFKLFVWNFFWSFFHLPSTLLKKLWNLVVYFVSKNIRHLTKFLFHSDGEMRAVILKIYYMSNGPNSIIHNRIPPNFKEVGGRWLEPDGTEVELELGFRVSVLRKAKLQLFHN